MVPESAGTFLAFLGLVAPGIVWERLAERFRPAVDRSAFREASEVALASLVFTTASLAILAITRGLRPAWMPDPESWLHAPRIYFRENYALIARFGLLEVGIAIGLAALVALLLYRRSPSPIRPISAWYRALREEVPDETTPVAQIFTESGESFFGDVVAYTPHDVPMEERELVLGGEVRMLPAPDAKWQPLTNWRRLIVPGAQIRAVVVTYRRSSS